MKGAGLQSHWPRWPVTLAVVAVIIVGGSAAVAKWPHAWWWLVAVMAAATAVIPPALAALSQISQRRLEIGRAVRAGFQGTIGVGGRELPTVGTAELEARVNQTVLPIPYIRRDEEDTVRAQLRKGRPVLLIGSSMVGKTKMAARVIAEEFSSWPVAIPDSKTALTDLDAKDVTLQETVIWLDDLDRLIGADGITDGALRRLAAAGNVIVATIRSRAYDQFQPSDQLKLPQWDVLSVFEHVFISRNLTEREQQRLGDAVPDQAIRDRIRVVGLGEYVGAARQVAEVLQLGAAGTEPLGYALILAAADWRRCGMTRPIPLSVLAQLTKPHLDERGQALLADQDAFKTGLAWSTRTINPNVSILQPAGADTYILYDYALDLISAQETPVPDSNWAEIITNVNAVELVTLGWTAENTYHLHEIAAEAYRKAMRSGHAAAVPRAALGLGVLLYQQGDVQGAQDAYQKVIDFGDNDKAPVAALVLGALLAEQGNVQGAQDAYQKVIDSGDNDQAPLAAKFLGALLAEQGDVPGAKLAYQKAIDSQHKDAGPDAALRLGELLREQGDVPGAKLAYQQAIDSQHEDAAPRAALRLGDLLRERGDVPGAKNAYQQAIDSQHKDAAPVAAVSLGALLMAQGDVPGAQVACQRAIDSQHEDAAPLAAEMLRYLLQGEGTSSKPPQPTG